MIVFYQIVQELSREVNESAGGISLARPFPRDPRGSNSESLCRPRSLSGITGKGVYHETALSYIQGLSSAPTFTTLPIFRMDLASMPLTNYILMRIGQVVKPFVGACGSLSREILYLRPLGLEPRTSTLKGSCSTD